MTDASRVETQRDVERLRRRAREMGREAGLDTVSSEQLSLAVSELATNLVRYARGGRINLELVDEAGRGGVQVECSDDGPGIASVDDALTDGFSTGNSMGSGLPSVRRMMDTFSIRSGPAGTHIVALKWARRSTR